MRLLMTGSVKRKMLIKVVYSSATTEVTSHWSYHHKLPSFISWFNSKDQ